MTGTVINLAEAIQRRRDHDVAVALAGLREINASQKWVTDTVTAGRVLAGLRAMACGLQEHATPLPARVRGASLEGAVLRELREHSGWDTSGQACLRILEWLRDETR